MKQTLSYEDDDAYRNFINSLKSSQTRKTYSLCLKLYLKYHHVEEPNKLLKDDIKQMQADVFEYLPSSQVSTLVVVLKAK